MDDLFYSDACASTNDEIIRFLPAVPSSFTAVYTFNQTAGRGQYGNIWETHPDENIAYSVAVPCDRISVSDFLLNYCTALIFRDFIANLTHKNTAVKWPNDLIIGHKKIAGILIEKKKVNELWYYIIGIGINVLQKNFTHLPQAGSLFTQTKKIFELKYVTQMLHRYFAANLFLYRDEEKIMKDYNTHLYRKGEISVFDIQGIRQNGMIQKALSSGKLEIELDNGLQTFFHKEIQMLY